MDEICFRETKLFLNKHIVRRICFTSKILNGLGKKKKIGRQKDRYVKFIILFPRDLVNYYRDN